MNFHAFLSYIAGLTTIVVAVLILSRDVRSFVHRIFAVGMGILALEAVLAGLGYQAASVPEVISWQHRKLMVTCLLPGIWLLFSLSFARANYLDYLKRWKWLIGGVLLLPLTITLLFRKFLFLGQPVIDESSSLFFRLGLAGYALYIIYLLGAVLILMNLERTLRHSIGHSRWQIKFIILGIGSIFGARIYTDSQAILFRLLEIDMDIVDAGVLLLANILIAFSLRRTKLLKFDFYLSHSVLYNSFTVLLVGIYFIAVGLITRLIFYLQGTQNPALTAFFVFVAILGVAVFLLSDRLRLERKRLISRHFHRPRYDYPRVWSRFTERTASLTDMQNLCSNIVRITSETLETLSVSIWLVDEHEEHLFLGASTDFSEKQAQELAITGESARALIQAMHQQTLPVNLRESTDDWVGDLQDRYGRALSEARIDLCVPMSAAGSLVGLLTLGGRVSHEPFSFEDLELIKTINDQAAANLLTIKLGERLQHAKEMEAFQVMSAFFIHDLKNLASRLSLLTQNLPVHFNNPEFRNDALRTISQSLEKINGMCGRLSMLSQKLEVHLVEIDLIEVVKSVLAGLGDLLKAAPTVSLHPLPKLMLDPEQIQKVLTNLLLNANEAIQAGGSIQVTTAQEDHYAVVCVTDNGCGISPDFISRSLFRPFQTTKKQGMGIGLFHSKKILEAHQGKILVESEEGKGTTFRVLLPLQGDVPSGKQN